MFKKNKKQTENVKEKKVRTVKVGTHKKTVIALWVVLIASVSFGVYKNFTASFITFSASSPHTCGTVKY